MHPPFGLPPVRHARGSAASNHAEGYLALDYSVRDHRSRGSGVDHLCAVDRDRLHTMDKGGSEVSKITRGDPQNLTNVRSNIYHHYIRVDNPTVADLPVRSALARCRRQAGRRRRHGGADAPERSATCEPCSKRRAARSTTSSRSSSTRPTCGEFKEIVAARTEFFTTKLPTSTIVEVNHLADPGLLIEFQAIAAL